MKPKNKSIKFKVFNTKFKFTRPDLYAMPILMAGLIITGLLTLLIYNTVETQERRFFIAESHELKQMLVSRLESHAQMLRSGGTFIMMRDTVTRNDWRAYFLNSRVERFLPGLQGIGYVRIVPADLLDEHVQEIRNEGFPEYSIYPSYEREMYTSIVYVEPFTGRNRTAFGYDMYTEPVRRKAMEISRDYDVATLTDRIKLEIETGGEELYGTLMFVPVYEKDAPADTEEQRRQAIRGWVYSPYRIKTLMDGILKPFYQENGYQVKLYNEKISDTSLLFDSRGIGTEVKKSFGTVEFIIPVEFNTSVWQLYFSRPASIPVRAIITLITGVVISLLLYFLARVFSKIATRSQKIRNQNEELSKLNATKDKFFSIIAHDLKSPYNAVLGFSDVLYTHAETMDRKEIKRMSGIIRHSSELAVELLTNLMVWSQSQTGRMEYVPQKLDVAKVINEVVFLFVDIARQKEIEIVQNLQAQSIAFADREMMSTVLRNLISNAIKFTHPGGRVIISAVKQVNNLVISVADTGVGISKENMKNLFHIDKNYTTVGTKKEKGTGLGLILCREFVERHGGEIWVESKIAPLPDPGSTFSFTLPAASG